MKGLYLLLLFSLGGLCMTSCSKDDPGTDDPDNPGNGKPYGLFTKKDFSTYKDVSDFIPAGIYQYDSGKKNYCFAWGTDGSHLPSIAVNEGDLQPDWLIYYSDRYYNLLYRNKQWVRQEHHNQTGDAYKAALNAMLYVEKVTLLSFISSDHCEEQPMSASDETVAGIAVKHYTYENIISTIVTRTEYWIMKTGLCLKWKKTISVQGSSEQPNVSETTFTSVNFDVSDLNNITPKLPVLKGADAVPAYNSLFLAMYQKIANEWLTDKYPRSVDNWVKKYTGPGTITSMTVWHNETEKYFDKFVNLEVNLTGASHQDILNYINTVKTIPDMTQTGLTDMELGGVHLFSWEGGNDCGATKICNHQLNEVGHGIHYEIIRSGTGYLIKMRIWHVYHV